MEGQYQSIKTGAVECATGSHVQDLLWHFTNDMDHRVTSLLP